MKRFLTVLMVASIFSLVACGPSEEEKAAAEAEATEMIEGLMGDLEEVADDKPEHVCDEKCKGEAGCTGSKCGEADHECTEACHAKTEGEHTCGESCSTGTHKCGEHCQCGDDCTCAEGATCSGKCEIKKEATEE